MSSILIHHHPGLGDHIMCHGIVREYAKKYDKVALFSLPHNFTSVSFMYRDLKNVTVIKGSEAFAEDFVTKHGSDYTEVKIIGFQNLDRMSSVQLEKQLYHIAGVPLEKIWDSFFVQRDLKNEQALFDLVAPNNEYFFLHEDVPRNYRIERKLIAKKYTVVSADSKITDNVFDYCTVIERAKEIHVIDSSFMFLIDCLQYENSDQKLFVHRYARENEVWKLPILKKNWTVLTLTDNAAGKDSSLSKFIDRTENLFLTHPLFKRLTRKLYRTFNWRTRTQKRGGAI